MKSAIPRDSEHSRASFDLDSLRNFALASFEHSFWCYDIFLIVLFLSLGILMQFPDVCSCWCASAVEISIGTSCIPILYFLSNSIFVLLQLLRSRESSEPKDEETKLCKALSIALGFGLFCELWSKPEAADRALSNISKTSAEKREKVVRKLKIIHCAGFAASYGALIVCMCLGLSPDMLKYSSLWVSFTMWFAHAFNAVILLGISGNACASKRAAYTTPAK